MTLPAFSCPTLSMVPAVIREFRYLAGGPRHCRCKDQFALPGSIVNRF